LHYADQIGLDAVLASLENYTKELGFRHVEINTNGVQISKSVEYAKELKAAGLIGSEMEMIKI